MFIRRRTLSILVLLPSTHAQTSGTGTTTRYFDCCKPSCGYPGKLTPASFSNVVRSCSINDTPLADFNAQSACAGGSAYTCSDQTPWAVSETLAYGFAAVNIAGGNEKSWCCACYELTFASGGVAGKRMIVQVTNTGGDLGVNHFDLAIPGGGFGIFDACTTEWKDTSTDWGARYGGISTRAQCDTFPEQLKPGCYWRFDWFLNADNPPVSFKQVSCPAALTERSGCVRADDEQIPMASSAVSSYGGVSSTEILSQGTSTSTGSRSTGASISTSTKTSSLSTSVPASETGTGTGSSGLVAAYGQCGGRDWNGGTQCIGGYTCVPQAGNPYYSQCLPTPSTLSSLSRSTASALTSSSSSSPGTSQSTTILTKTSQSSTLSDYGPTPSPGSGTTAPSYGQCGGIGWTGPTACGLGYTCQVTNPYYSQCVPNPTDPGAVPAYGQCGGLNYNGARMCTVGYTCKIVNPYYSQCLPS